MERSACLKHHAYFSGFFSGSGNGSLKEQQKKSSNGGSTSSSLEEDDEDDEEEDPCECEECEYLEAFYSILESVNLV